MKEMGRGSSAIVPLVLRVYKRFHSDRIPEVAAGATFFILLAIFPAFASIVTLYGLIADRASILDILHLVSPIFPRGANIVLTAELHRLVAQDVPKLGVAFLVSALTALWSASGGLKAIVHGLNIAYDVDETRGLLYRSLLAFAITAAAILLSVLAITFGTILPILARQLSFQSMLRTAISILGWPIAFFFSFTVLSGIYSYGPNRPRSWRWWSWGSTLSSLSWLTGTFAFKWYVRHFGNFDRVYGNLGAIVGFLVWIWLSVVIVLFGAELNRELERHSNECNPSVE